MKKTDVQTQPARRWDFNMKESEDPNLTNLKNVQVRDDKMAQDLSTTKVAVTRTGLMIDDTPIYLRSGELVYFRLIVTDPVSKTHITIREEAPVTVPARSGVILGLRLPLPDGAGELVSVYRPLNQTGVEE